VPALFDIVHSVRETTCVLARVSGGNTDGLVRYRKSFSGTIEVSFRHFILASEDSINAVIGRATPFSALSGFSDF